MARQKNLENAKAACKGTYLPKFVLSDPLIFRSVKHLASLCMIVLCSDVCVLDLCNQLILCIVYSQEVSSSSDFFFTFVRSAFLSFSRMKPSKNLEATIQLLKSTTVIQGRFDILSLSRAFVPNENLGAKEWSAGMSVSLAGPDGRVLGGRLAGMPVAAGPFQKVVMEPAMQGCDMIGRARTGRARTGTGKTLAFGIPIMDKIIKYNKKNGQESIAGKICVDPVQGKKVEHNGIKIELLGQIETYFDRGNFYDFTSLVREVDVPGKSCTNISSTSDDITQKLKENFLQKLNFLESQMSPYS
ncbi:hypothetical protein L2E82_14413 [Cichorium intybus]|uniref:Uncharacterized protein n=1 Tax=Cichorium intybus TaxID=13427 RepID=A0ACB9F0C1_CICIN|nr:hypothetical protein L2E82_14413 [Cichorium intybus]